MCIRDRNYIPLFYKSENSLKKHLITSVEYSHRESFYNYHFFELKHNNINLNDSIFILNTNYFSEIINSDLGYLSLSYEFDRDFRDFKNYPLEGFRLNVNVEKDGLGILGRLNKLKFRIYYSNYIKLKNNNYYSFNPVSYTHLTLPTTPYV